MLEQTMFFCSVSFLLCFYIEKKKKRSRDRGKQGKVEDDGMTNFVLVTINWNGVRVHVSLRVFPYLPCLEFFSLFEAIDL